MAGNNVDIFINGKTNFTEAALNPTIGGLGRLNEALERSKSTLRGWNSLFEIGFGLRVGRAFFEGLHEGAMKFGESFSASLLKGRGAMESFREGLAGSLGVETSLQRLEQQTEKNAAAFEHMFQAGQSAMDVLFGAKPKPFANLGEGGVSAGDKLRASIKEQREKLATAEGEINKNLRVQNTHGFGGLSQRIAEYNMTPWQTIGYVFSGGLARPDPSQSTLDAWGTEASAARANIARNERNLHALGMASGLKSLSQRLFGTAGAEASYLGGMASSAAGLLGFKARAAIGGLMEGGLPAQPESAESLREKALSLTRSLSRGEGREAGNIAAENQRFLTRGPGSKTPELTALEKIQAALEAQVKADDSKKLNDILTLLRKLGASIGTVDSL